LRWVVSPLATVAWWIRDPSASGWKVTATTRRQRLLPSGKGHTMESPSARPSKAVPTGASTETFPRRTSASCGKTIVTSVVLPLKKYTAPTMMTIAATAALAQIRIFRVGPLEEEGELRSIRSEPSVSVSRGLC